MHIKRFPPLFTLLVTILGWQHSATAGSPDAASAPVAQRELLLSTLWFQRSPEYQLIARATFRNAEEKLPAAIQSPGSAAPEQQTSVALTALPPAVVVDLDETMLDNSPYEGHLAATGLTYDHDDSWRKWIALRQANAVPGAVEFSNAVARAGASIFYVSNRNCGTDPACGVLTDTMVNMQRLGFARADDPKAFLLQGMNGWSSEKSPRRAMLAQSYRIVMLLGDDLRDFLSAGDAGKVTAGDKPTTDFALTMLGARWFVLPNPMYGSWQRNLVKTSDPLGDLYGALLPAPLNAPTALADESAACAAAKGTYVLGKVVSAPTFASAKQTLQGVQLTHTHIGIQQNVTGIPFDIAIDNVFANDYSENSDRSPPSLQNIKVGDSLSTCGQTYPGGIHWVHTNCNQPVSPSKPNGWLKLIAQDGQPGANIEALQDYCYLWGEGQKPAQNAVAR